MISDHQEAGPPGASQLSSHDRRAADEEHTSSRSGAVRTSVVDREREEHGGIKVGSAFFGWLTATGMAVLLTALAAAAGAVFGLATDTTVENMTDTAAAQSQTVGIVGGILLLIIVLVAYYCGGYVAGRMARFDGLKQGLGVWLWAIAMALLAAPLGAVAGGAFNVLAELNAFPRLPVGEGTLTTGGIVTLLAVLAASLGGALAGGLAGMRFHRRVGRTGPDA